MKDQAATTIEYFLCIEENNEHSRLLYFDKDGRSVEKDISRAVLDNALKFFSKKARAVRRSSGGLILAEPTQIVLYEKPGTGTEVRVKVRFRDFTRANGAHYVISHTKVVSPDELTEPFSYQFEGERAQTFALDFGRGIVPVQVFGYEEHEGTEYAYFLELADADRLNRRGDTTVRVQPYRVERSALRWTGAAGELPSAEQEQALINYRRLQRLGKHVIPRELRAGAPVDVPPRTGEETTEFLRARMQRRFSHGAQVIHIHSAKDEADTDAETVWPIALAG